MRPRRRDIPPAISDAQAGRLRTRGVEPWHQKHWDWKAAGNFLCGGAGAGLFAASAFAGLNGLPVAAPALAALALVASGLFLLMFKLGRPLRFLYVLRQPKRSWMTREAWVVFVWFPFALFALWTRHPPFLLPAAMLALLFLFCQGMILEQSKGIPAWRNPRVIPLILATGLAEGCGLFLLLALCSCRRWPRPPSRWLSRSSCWPRRGSGPGGAISARSKAKARRRGRWKSSPPAASGFSPPATVLPLALVVLGLILPAADAVLFALAGLSVFATGWAIKFILITRAAYNQGFALPHTPIRGSGIPGPAVKPGWTSP